MGNISFLKKVKMFFIYKKIVDLNKKTLLDNSLNLRIDNVYRIYTVLNMTDDVKTYGISVAERIITEYVQKMDVVFSNMNLSEYIGILDVEQLSETDFLIVFGFSHFNTAKLLNKIIKWTLASSLGIFGIYYLLF